MPSEQLQAESTSAAAWRPIAGDERRRLYMECLALSCRAPLTGESFIKQADAFYDALVAKCGEPQ